MTSVILSLLYVLSFTVSGFVGKSLRPRCSSEISLMRNFASATPAGAGEVDFQPSSISSVTKRDCSLAVTMAAAVLMLPKITAATTAASLGVDKDGYFECELFSQSLSVRRQIGSYSVTDYLANEYIIIALDGYHVFSAA